MQDMRNNAIRNEFNRIKKIFFSKAIPGFKIE